MLKHTLLHPHINAVLGRAGHHAKVLIADANYPASTVLGPRAELVSLNLSPGIVNCPQVLEVLIDSIPLERAFVMAPDLNGPYAQTMKPAVWDLYHKLLEASSNRITLEHLQRHAFYQMVATPEHVLTIQTADCRLFANLLLEIGVIVPAFPGAL